MKTPTKPLNSFDRRKFLSGALRLPLSLWFAGSSLSVFQAVYAATPECKDGDDVTPSETAGPFYKPDSPMRTSFLEGATKGGTIILTGTVFSRDCRPVPKALLDFWHTDENGDYDNAGFRMRGHQFADAEGKYRLETIVPGAYSGRTRHIHVRVQPPNGRILTTQLYFPGEKLNNSDFLFNPELLMQVNQTSRAMNATFHFILSSNQSASAMKNRSTGA